MNKPVGVPTSAYSKLEQRFRRLSALQEAAGMLHWDMSAVMPDGGRPARAEQLATLGVVCHEILTDAETGALLDQAEAEASGLTPWQRANLAEMRRGYTHATALSGDLVEALSKACTACEAVWRDARPKADFAAVLRAGAAGFAAVVLAGVEPSSGLALVAVAALPAVVFLTVTALAVVALEAGLPLRAAATLRRVDPEPSTTLWANRVRCALG